MSIPLKSIQTFSQTYLAVQKEIGLEQVTITMEPEREWSPVPYWRIMPRITGIPSWGILAKICEATNWYVPLHAINQLSYIEAQNYKYVASQDMAVVGSPIKYYCDASPAFVANGFAQVVPMLITGAPVELADDVDNRRFRGFNGEANDSFGLPDTDSRRSVIRVVRTHFVVSTDSPYYNYLDKGHIIFFCGGLPDGGAPQIFITDQLDINVYHFAALFSIMGNKLKPLLRHNVFLSARLASELRQTLATAERSVPEKWGQRYNLLKAAIRADFDEKSQHTLISKFRRGDLKEATLNGIKLSHNRAVYEPISIEAEGLAEQVLSTIDWTATFDIYAFVAYYVTGLVRLTEKQPLSSVTHGFAEAKDWTLTINNIPITLSLNTTNTRRKVNRHCINASELAQVIRRATCYTDAANYDKFLRQVERTSLRIHSALAHGYPINLGTIKDEPFITKEQRAGRPRIFFTSEKNKYYLWLNKERNQRVPLCRFVKLLDSIRVINNKADGRYIPRAESHPSGSHHRDSRWYQWELEHILQAHAVGADGVSSITREQSRSLTAWLLEARTEAERKSKELLKTVVEETGAVESVTRSNTPAYDVTGMSGNVYTVEKESFRVWDKTTGAYICIVDGRGEMGIGYDALVARLLALKNDTYVVDKIGTLGPTVARPSSPSPRSARALALQGGVVQV